MVKYRIEILKAAQKDKEKIKSIPALKKRVDALLAVLRENPFQNPPPYEKLAGSLNGLYSRRINVQHRLVYRVKDDCVQIVGMRSHHEF